MTEQPAGRAELSTAKYVAFTTFRRSGVPVTTPVWIAPDGDDLVFISVDNVGKTKRLAHTARVQLQPCDFRGAVEPGAATYDGTAVVQRGVAELAVVRKALERKYFSARAMNRIQALLDRLGRVKPRAAVRISLD